MYTWLFEFVVQKLFDFQEAFVLVRHFPLFMEVEFSSSRGCANWKETLYCHLTTQINTQFLNCGFSHEIIFLSQKKGKSKQEIVYKQLNQDPGITKIIQLGHPFRFPGDSLGQGFYLPPKCLGFPVVSLRTLFLHPSQTDPSSSHPHLSLVYPGDLLYFLFPRRPIRSPPPTHLLVTQSVWI